MKRVDESTLETIAELVCGSGGGSSDYLTPGPYRSMGGILAFFNRAGVRPQGQSSTRKWFVLESLQSGNGTDDLGKVLLRLASPREYGGDYALLHMVVEHANRVLRLDGLEIVLIEGEPELREHHSSVGRLSRNPQLSRNAEVSSSLEEDTSAGHEVSPQGSDPSRDGPDTSSQSHLIPDTPTTVFLGHGRFHIWRELKDFLEDRLGLRVDEFNRIPTAGIATTERLSAMLDAASIAFLVMTAEDEQADGQFRARENVIHEVGLFQGRFGFQRAIVLLEEGCQEFSNITGLGQIRFPPGSISAAFEEIRKVLEREGFIGEV